MTCRTQRCRKVSEQRAEGRWTSADSGSPPPAGHGDTATPAPDISETLKETKACHDVEFFPISLSLHAHSNLPLFESTSVSESSRMQILRSRWFCESLIRGLPGLLLSDRLLGQIYDDCLQVINTIKLFTAVTSHRPKVCGHPYEIVTPQVNVLVSVWPAGGLSQSGTRASDLVCLKVPLGMRSVQTSQSSTPNGENHFMMQPTLCHDTTLA